MLSRLITPPATPLFPSLEMEPQKTSLSQIEEPNVRDSAPLKSRVRTLDNISSAF